MITMLASLLLSIPPAPDFDPQSAKSQQAERLAGDTQAFLAALDSDDEPRMRATAEPLVPELTALLNNGVNMSEERRVGIKTLRGLAFWTLDRIEEADRDLLTLAPRTILDSGYWEFRLDRAIEENDGATLARLLIIDAAGVERPEDAHIHNLSLDNVFAVNNAIDDDETRKGAFHQALVDAGFDSGAPPGDRDYLYRWVFSDRFARGDIDGAREALLEMHSPYSFIEYLTVRKYAEFWPMLEERNGRDLGLVVARYSAELDQSKNLADPRYRLTYGNQLKDTGEYDRIVEEISPFVADWAQLAEEGEYGLWSVNTVADAEMKTGRVDSALLRMTALSERGDPRYSIGMRINRLLMMLDARQFADALAGAEALSEIESNANEFGRMYIRQAAACSAYELGRVHESERWGEQIEAAPEENRGATLAYYLCTDDLNTAERFMVEWLESDSPGGLIGTLQDYRRQSDAGLWNDELDARRREVVARPAVQEALQSVGRVLSLELAE